MNLLLLLQMAADGRGDQVAVVADGAAITAAELLAAACAGARLVGGDDEAGAEPVQNLVLVATNGLAFPIGLFAAAVAEVPFVPLNYRLSDDQLVTLLEPLGTSLVV